MADRKLRDPDDLATRIARIVDGLQPHTRIGFVLHDIKVALDEHTVGYAPAAPPVEIAMAAAVLRGAARGFAEALDTDGEATAGEHLERAALAYAAAQRGRS
jgi:hypothetical protein